MPATPSFKDMPLWQRSMQLAIEICQTSLQLPSSTKLVVTTEIQQAAIDIPTSLARGAQNGKKGMLAAIQSSRQYAAELETLLIIMQNLTNDKTISELLIRTEELQHALITTAQRLSAPAPARKV